MTDGVTFTGWAYTNDQYLGYGFFTICKFRDW